MEQKEQAQKHFETLPVWPSFEVKNYLIDGRIPSCQVGSWEEFDKLVKEYSDNDVEGNYVFRGQRHYKWQLQPTLDRYSDGPITPEIARKQLDQFKLSIRGRLADKSVLEHDNELWALGQHHGLATPLLDWTLSPYVALFFAFEAEDDPNWKDDNGEPDNHSRTVFILNKSFIKDLEGNDEYPKIVEPVIDDHGRLVNQAGLFTIAPNGETLETSLLKALDESDVDSDNDAELAKYICRVHIPNSPQFRRQCLNKLRKMNIHHASLFPDLIGASGYCNALIAEALQKTSVDRETVSEDTIEVVHPVKNGNDVAPVVNVEPVQPAAPAHKQADAADDFNLHKGEERPVTQEAVFQSWVASLDAQLKQEKYESALRSVFKMAEVFALNNLSVDWHRFETSVARLRIKMRREIKRRFPEHLSSDTTESLVSTLQDAWAEKAKQETQLSDHDAGIVHKKKSAKSPDYAIEGQ